MYLLYVNDQNEINEQIMDRFYKNAINVHSKIYPLAIVKFFKIINLCKIESNNSKNDVKYHYPIAM